MTDVCARCGLGGNLLDLDTGSVCHPYPQNCIDLLRGERDRLAERVEEQQAQLAECYRLSGADTDGDEEWRYAPHAVQAVAELRADYDEACNEVAELARLSEGERGWRPIETAPTNTAVLIHVEHDDYYGNNGCYAAILVDMGTGRRWFTFGRSVGRDLLEGLRPTHWMPLPAPPAEPRPTPDSALPATPARYPGGAMSTGKVLLGPPPEPDPTYFWRMLCLALCIVSPIATMSAYGMGMKDAVAVKHEARIAQEMLEQCLRANDELVTQAARTARLLAQRSEAQRWVIGMTAGKE